MIFCSYFLFVSCTTRPLGWQKASLHESVSLPEVQVAIKTSATSWELRYEKNHLVKALELYEKIYFSPFQELASSPTKQELAEKLSRGYYIWAEYFESNNAVKVKYWKLGGEWAQRGLELNPYFFKAAQDKGHFIPGLKYLTKEQAGAVYWYLANIGRWALNSGVNTSLKYKELIKEMTNRGLELSPNYFYGGFYRILGAYYGVLPSYAGGDLEKSYFYFNKAKEIGTNYFATRVLMAKAYAAYKSDKDLYEKLLKGVLQDPNPKDSDIYAENYLEQQRAQQMLREIKNIFP
jgi:hypothetical protein